VRKNLEKPIKAKTGFCSTKDDEEKELPLNLNLTFEYLLRDDKSILDTFSIKPVFLASEIAFIVIWCSNCY
jgi:hypothetical protein